MNLESLPIFWVLLCLLAAEPARAATYSTMYAHYLYMFECLILLLRIIHRNSVFETFASLSSQENGSTGLPWHRLEA
jgi:hypothetical protein